MDKPLTAKIWIRAHVFDTVIFEIGNHMSLRRKNVGNIVDATSDTYMSYT